MFEHIFESIHTPLFLVVEEWRWQSITLLIVESLLVYAYIPSFGKVSGPLFSKLSSWSIFIQAASGNRHLESWMEHEIYGSIVRIGPNTLSINTISALRDIYGARKSNVQKADWYHTIDYPSGAYSTHSEIDNTKHSFKRRVLGTAFSDAALRSVKPFVIENVRAWCNQLGAGAARPGEWTPAKNMNEWNTYLGYDVMGDLTFGKRFNCLYSDEHRYVPGMMVRGTRFIYIIGFLPFIKLVRPLLGSPFMNYLVGASAQDNSAYVKYANGQMEQRIADEQDSSKRTRNDFMHYLIRAKDPQTGQGFTRTELNSESSLLISAGSDTVSITLSATLFYLLHNPPTLTKATNEVRAAFTTIDDITTSPSLSSSLLYLRACIDEALRLTPPVPAHLPRQVLPGGLVIDGHSFPAGTVLGVSPYAIHHCADYFPQPFSFVPERWLPPTAEADHPGAAVTERAAFCAFSLGPRGCVGKSVAYLELLVAMAALLAQYDVRLPAEGRREREPSGEGWGGAVHWGRRRVGEYQLVDQFLADRDGPMVQFRKR